MKAVGRETEHYGRKVNLSHGFAGQKVGVTQVSERIWLVTFMHYDLGYFDDETCRLEPIQNPFGPKVLPIRPEYTVTSALRMDTRVVAPQAGLEPATLRLTD